ncbi:MAG: FtsX-like permease family protein [Alphaproteobacteria bacterium]|nr:FtsX-like permease family protein [Alphaproteobacteria bacterium]
MSFWASIRVALRALRVNALRSALTMLGIIIGVGAVITMVAVGSGAQQRVAEQIKSLGSNLIVALPGNITAGGVRMGLGSRVTITDDDAVAIQREVPSVQVAAPSVRGSAQLVYGNQNWASLVQGITPEYMEAREWEVIEGRSITGEDVQSTARVVLVGQTVVRNLFNEEDPIDRTIRVRDVPFRVIGVLGYKGQNTQGQDQDDIVIVPLSTARKRVLGFSQVRARSVGSILIKVQHASQMNEAMADVRDLLRQRHRLQPNDEDDFSLRNLSEVMATQEASSRILTLLLAAVASVSLVVGGIGIMNIMLVSVTERTREIGLRMAVGARGTDIMAQFLIEAVTLSLIGGAIGILAGVASSHAIASFAGWPTLIRVEFVLIAFLFSGAVGVFFGFYPARKAARLDPIEALRFE